MRRNSRYRNSDVPEIDDEDFEHDPSVEEEDSDLNDDDDSSSSSSVQQKRSRVKRRSRSTASYSKRKAKRRYYYKTRRGSYYSRKTKRRSRKKKAKRKRRNYHVKRAKASRPNAVSVVSLTEEQLKRLAEDVKDSILNLLTKRRSSQVSSNQKQQSFGDGDYEESDLEQDSFMDDEEYTPYPSHSNRRSKRIRESKINPSGSKLLSKQQIKIDLYKTKSDFVREVSQSTSKCHKRPIKFKSPPKQPLPIQFKGITPKSVTTLEAEIRSMEQQKKIEKENPPSRTDSPQSHQSSKGREIQVPIRVDTNISSCQVPSKFQSQREKSLSISYFNNDMPTKKVASSYCDETISDEPTFSEKPSIVVKVKGREPDQVSNTKVLLTKSGISISIFEPVPSEADKLQSALESNIHDCLPNGVLQKGFKAKSILHKSEFSSGPGRVHSNVESDLKQDEEVDRILSEKKASEVWKIGDQNQNYIDKTKLKKRASEQISETKANYSNSGIDQRRQSIEKSENAIESNKHSLRQQKSKVDSIDYKWDQFVSDPVKSVSGLKSELESEVITVKEKANDQPPVASKDSIKASDLVCSKKDTEKEGESGKISEIKVDLVKSDLDAEKSTSPMASNLEACTPSPVTPRETKAKNVDNFSAVFQIPMRTGSILPPEPSQIKEVTTPVQEKAIEKDPTPKIADTTSDPPSLKKPGQISETKVVFAKSGTDIEKFTTAMASFRPNRTPSCPLRQESKTKTEKVIDQQVAYKVFVKTPGDISVSKPKVVKGPEKTSETKIALVKSGNEAEADTKAFCSILGQGSKAPVDHQQTDPKASLKTVSTPEPKEVVPVKEKAEGKFAMNFKSFLTAKRNFEPKIPKVQPSQLFNKQTVNQKATETGEQQESKISHIPCKLIDKSKRKKTYSKAKVADPDSNIKLDGSKIGSKLVQVSRSMPQGSFIKNRSGSPEKGGQGGEVKVEKMPQQQPQQQPQPQQNVEPVQKHNESTGGSTEINDETTDKKINKGTDTETKNI